MRRPRSRDHSERPSDVTEVAREIYDHHDKGRLEKAVNRLGWRVISVNEYSGAWWIRKRDNEVMIVFGGPRQAARASSWRPVGGPTERI